MDIARRSKKQLVLVRVEYFSESNDETFSVILAESFISRFYNRDSKSIRKCSFKEHFAWTAKYYSIELEHEIKERHDEIWKATFLGTEYDYLANVEFRAWVDSNSLLSKSKILGPINSEIINGL